MSYPFKFNVGDLVKRKTSFGLSPKYSTIAIVIETIRDPCLTEDTYRVKYSNGGMSVHRESSLELVQKMQ